MKQLTILACMVLVPLTFMRANNITVTNVSLTDQVAASHYCNVKFDLSWDNSWRTTGVPNNWDAAWIFVKYRVSGGAWHHAVLSASAGDHTPASGSTITPSSDGKGVFIYRSSDGSGTNTWASTKIRWNYGTNGVMDDALLDIRVFAIEMVYIPTGSYYLGDGNGTSLSPYSFHSTTANSAVQITSSLTGNILGSCTMDDTPLCIAGLGIDGDGGIDANNDGSIDNPAWPTGYTGFYMMKYEVSQEQYCEFLNTLTRAQQGKRVYTDISGTSVTNRYVMSNTATIQYRQGIRCDATLPASGPVTFYCDYDGDGTYNETSDGQNLPCNYLTWMDHAAYADWSGLRPMTEVEFEKACRGANPAVYGEFAWGTANINPAVLTYSNMGYANESITNMSTTSGNAAYYISGTYLFYRCGIFAGSSANHTRQETGAGYYGVMELTGNLDEFTVHLGSVAGRSYTGLHGNGELNNAGDADVDYWPGINGNATNSIANAVYGGTTGVTAAAGSGVRGGDGGYTNTAYLTVSTRASVGMGFTSHGSFNGSRSVRTAP